MVSRRQESVLAGLFLLGILLLFFGRSLAPGQILSGADLLFSSPFFAETKPAEFSQPSNPLLFDQVYQFTPWRYFAWNSIRNGQLPLWNPYSSAGTPFVATMQSAVFYPINLLLTLVPFEYNLILSAVIRLWIAGFCTFLLARRYGLGRASSMTVSISFMLSGFLIVWLGHPHTNAAIWLPALVLLAETMVQATRTSRLLFITGLSALVVGIQFTGGHIETSVDIVFTMGLYYLFRWISIIFPLKKTLAFKLRYLVILPGLAAVLGAAVSAVQLAPFLEWLTTCAELHSRGGFFESFRFIDTGFWRQLFELPVLVFPNLYNNPTWNEYPYWSFFPWGGNYNEHVLYVGTLTLLFALTAMISQWKDQSLVRVWTFIGLISFGRAFHIPVFDWLNQIPILSLGHPERLRLIFSFSLCILAGFGANALWNRGASSQKSAEKLWIRGSLAVIAAGTLILIASNILLPAVREKIVSLGQERVNIELASRSTPPQHPIEYYYAEVDQMVDGLLAAFHFDNLAMYLPVLWAAAGLISLLWFRRHTGYHHGMFRVTLLVLVVLDLMSFGRGYNPSIPYNQFYPGTTIVRKMDNGESPFRITVLRQDLIPDAHMIFGLQEIRGLDFPTYWYNQYMNLVPSRIPWLSYGLIFDSVDSPLLSVLNIRYVIAARADKLEDNPDIRIIDQSGGVFLGEVINPTPRAFMVYETITADNDQETAEILKMEPDLIRTRAVLNGAGDAPRLTLLSNSRPVSHVESIDYMNEFSDWRVSTSEDGYLFLSDSYYPGWIAYMDNQPIELYRANLAFRAVFVPEGEHIISFQYKPISIRLGAVISIFALVLILILLILTYRDAYNPRPDRSGGS